MMDKVLNNARNERDRLTELEEQAGQLLVGTSAQHELATQLQDITKRLLKGESTGQIMKKENTVCARNRSNHRFLVEEKNRRSDSLAATCVDDRVVDGRDAAWQRMQIIYGKLDLVSQDVHELVSQSGELVAETNHANAETKTLIRNSGNMCTRGNHRE